MYLVKSTNLIYLRKQNSLCYNVHTKRLQNIFDKLEKKFIVKMHVLIEPIHYITFISNDALLFSILKSNAHRIASMPRKWPKTLSDLRNIFTLACHFRCNSSKCAKTTFFWFRRSLQSWNPRFPSKLLEWEQTRGIPASLDYDIYPISKSTFVGSEDYHNFWD